MSQSAKRPKTLDDLLAIPESSRFHELVGGEIVQKAAPSGEHGDAQAGVVGALRTPYHRRRDSGGPGGWWIAAEVEVLLSSGDVVRPDVLGWRRERCPQRPTGSPVHVAPDWVCEVVSPSHAQADTVTRLRLYHRVEIPHFWLVDPRDATLTVMRHSADGWITSAARAAQTFGSPATARSLSRPT